MNICELVRKTEQDYVSGSKTTISKYVEFDLYENINRVDAYLNSKHITGDKDSKGRDKPFFNIVTAAANIWFRATDIDRKDIKIKATKEKDAIKALLANIHLQEWMKKANFGKFLNNWGRTLARYGSAVCKFVEKDGNLYSEIIPWQRLICDAVDFDNNPKIEKLWFTPSQLRNNKLYNQDYVKEIIGKVSATRETLDKTSKDYRDGYIPVYEVHGLFSQADYNEAKGIEVLEGDEDIFFQQMHVICFLQTQEKEKYDNYYLYSGKEAKDPYMITHLIEEDGRTMSIGAVENLFESQWMVNHTAKQMKDQLDLASKLIFQTSDGNYVGRNALTSIENGDILIHAVNQPLTELNNTGHDITSLQNFSVQWQMLGKEITNTPDAQRGNTQPSGTPYALQSLITEQSNSLFELMTENKGFYIEEMARNFIIPHLKKKMDTADEISATLDANMITQIDARYIPNEAKRRVNNKLKNTILNKSVDEITDEDLMSQDTKNQEIATEAGNLRKELSLNGNQRFIKPSDVPDATWKEYFKDFEWEAEIEVTNEQTDKQAMLTTLSTVFQTIASLKGQPMSRQLQLVFNKILDTAGSVTSIELANANTEDMQQPAVGVGAPQVPAFNNLTT